MRNYAGHYPEQVRQALVSMPITALGYAQLATITTSLLYRLVSMPITALGYAQQEAGDLTALR